MRHVSRTHRVALGWLFGRITLDPKIQIKYIDTKNQLADTLTKGNFTRDEWNHLFCLFNISHFSSINSVKAMSKRTQEDAGEERVTAKSRPKTSLVSRWPCKGYDRTCLDCIWKTLGNTKPESQKVPLSSLNEQLTSTEWNPLFLLAHRTPQNGTMTTSGLLKCGNLVKCREQVTDKPVSNKLVIEIDMDSATAAESDLSLKTPFIPEQSEWPSAKDAEPFSRRFNARHWQMFCDLVNVYVFDIGSIFVHGKALLRQLAFHQKYRGKSRFTADVRDIWTVDIGTIGWDFWSVSNQLVKFSMQTVISGWWWRSHQSLACKGSRILRFCVLSWKDESEPNITYCLGTTVGMIQRFITIQIIGHNRGRTDGIRVEYFPRILNIGACPRSPKVHEQYGRNRTIPRTNAFHVDVQWHHLEKLRQWNGMYC